MADTQSKTLAPLLILKILEKYSDEQHPMTRKQIETILLEDYGIEMERKTFFRHIQNLNELVDVDICEIEHAKPTKDAKPCSVFYLRDRSFTDMELRLIIDSLSGNYFISESETTELIQRVAELSSKHFQKKIKHYKFMKHRGKTTNSTALYSLEVIEEAIVKKQKLTFNPIFTDTSGARTPSKYFRAPITPIQTLVKGQTYYLIGLQDGALHSWRISDIANITILDEPAEPLPAQFKNGIDYDKLLREHPDMSRFEDDAQLCTFHCHKSMLPYFQEYFGMELRVSPVQHELPLTFTDPSKGTRPVDLLEISVITTPSAAVDFSIKHMEWVWLVAPVNAVRSIRLRISQQQKRYDYLAHTYGYGVPPRKKK